MRTKFLVINKISLHFFLYLLTGYLFSTESNEDFLLKLNNSNREKYSRQILTNKCKKLESQVYVGVDRNQVSKTKIALWC